MSRIHVRARHVQCALVFPEVTVLFMLLSATLSHAAPDAYVLASTLSLRSAPSGALVATLRANTPVQTLREEEGWSFVELSNRPESDAVRGWVSTDLLSQHEVSGEKHFRRAMEANALEDRILHGERAVAVRPDWEPYGGGLAGWYAQAGRDDDARHARQLGNDGAVWLAQCVDGRAVVLGSVGSGGLSAHASWEEGEEGDALKLGSALSRLPWWSHDGQHAHLLWGSPFVMPFVAPRHYEEGGTPYRAGEDVLGIGTFVLVLGPCRGDVLLSTAALSERRRDALPLAEHGALQPRIPRDLVDPDRPMIGMDAGRLDELLELGLSRYQDRFGCGGPGWVELGRDVLLYEGDTLVYTSAQGSDTYATPVDTGPMRWFSVPSSPLRLGVAEAEWNLAEGFTLVQLGGEAVEVAQAMIRTSGC